MRIEAYFPRGNKRPLGKAILEMRGPKLPEFGNYFFLSYLLFQLPDFFPCSYWHRPNHRLFAAGNFQSPNFRPFRL